ncbi:MAG: helix-turn-helix transcriptional regulator [Clostridia bacterium]|nr:helix-turn-helix transcriptional regulator [Clostridia bacterium]
MKYNECIRFLREDADKTQTEIASILQIGQRTYCDYESGKTRIPVDSLIILAKYYNVDMNFICGVSNVKEEFPKK